MSQTVRIIIPAYRGQALLRECLISVLGTTSDEREVVVVDDAVDQSESSGFQTLCQKFGVSYQRTPHNLGFIGATRQGAAGADREYLLFLNSDIQAVEWGWLETMLAELADPQVGIVGARLLYPDTHRIQHAGVARNEGGVPYHPFAGAPGDLPQALVTREVNATTGGCLLMRRSLWESLGGWRAEFGKGVFEDVDLCWRARQAGFKVIYQPRAVLLHHESASRDPNGLNPLHDGDRPGALSSKNIQILLKLWQGTECAHSDEHLFELPLTYAIHAALALLDRMPLPVQLEPMRGAAKNGSNQTAQLVMLQFHKYPPEVWDQFKADIQAFCDLINPPYNIQTDRLPRLFDRSATSLGEAEQRVAYIESLLGKKVEQPESKRQKKRR